MACVLCGSPLDSAPVVNEIARNGTPQRMVACSRCGMCQASPMPSADVIAEYYESGRYRREFPPMSTEAEEIADADGAAEWMRAALAITPETSILEIGCGYGRIAARLGAEAVEVDPGMRAEAESRGVKVRAAWRCGEYAPDYGLVYALQVLEHQPDPVGTLVEWREAMAPGGRIHLQVPTIERMYGGAAHFFQWPHMVNFTARTLTIALLMAGYSEVQTLVAGAVLAATATKGVRRTYEQSAAVVGGEPDDVRALVSMHERQRVEHMLRTEPGRVEQWIAGTGERPSDDELRRALTHIAGLADAAVSSITRLSMAAETSVMAADAKWSLVPWVRGYQAGQASEAQRWQQALAHTSNALRVRAER